MDCNKWDRNYLGLAEHVSKWSKDPSSQVGAVIVKNNRVVAVGFNGFPAEVEDKQEWLGNRKVKYEMVVHAEVNALIVAGQRAEGATIYVYGRPVCSSCAGAIIQAGIARVVSKAPSSLEGGLEGGVKLLSNAP
jgi:dCMP deaminase